MVLVPGDVGPEKRPGSGAAKEVWTWSKVEAPGVAEAEAFTEAVTEPGDALLDAS
jgi:hypothetical protein